MERERTIFAAALLRPGTSWERSDAERDGWAHRLPALHESLREATSSVIRCRPPFVELVVRARYAFTFGVPTRAHRADGVVLLSPDYWDTLDDAGRTGLIAEAALTFGTDQLRRKARLRAPERIRSGALPGAVRRNTL